MLADGGGEPSTGWRRSWKGLLAAFAAGAAVSALVSVVVVGWSGGSGQLVTTGRGRGHVPVTTLPSPAVPTTVTTAPAPTVAPATTLAPATGGPSLTGTVTDTSGRPVAGAYVIGLESLTVVRTDSSGRYAMPCKVSEGALTGERSEPLVASPWVLPVIPSGQGSYAVGVNTTKYGPPPTTPGLGYAFSGGAKDAADATVVTCEGRQVNFVLPAGGGADVQFLNADGSPASDSQFQGPPVDNLYVPGLGDHGALDTSPLSATGHQMIMQLGPGVFGLDVLYPMTCTEAGVQLSPDAAARGLGVTIVPGRTAEVTCRLTGGGSNGSSPQAPTTTYVGGN